CVWSRTPASEPEAAVQALAEALSIVHRLARRAEPPRLFWVTEGAIGLAPSDEPAPALASLWGLGRTLRHEHPELDCTLIDVVREGAEDAITELRGGDEEREIAWRRGQRHVARLVKTSPLESPARSLRNDGSVIVTGGLGALGLHAARWLA